MRKRHYLPKREEELVDSEYGQKCIYKHLRSLAMRTEKFSDYFSLSPADLFYHVICTIDSLIEKIVDDEVDEIEYSRDLWQELKSHFAENVECDDKDHMLAATLVLCATTNLLVIGNRAKYWDVCNQLMQSTKEEAYEIREQIEKIIEDVLYSDNAYKDLKERVVHYSTSHRIWSDEIATKILELREQNSFSGMENIEELTALLKEYFWNDTGETDKFIKEIHGKDDFTVIEVISRRVNAKPQKMQRKNKSKLWEILHKYNLYRATKVNFSNLLKNKGY